MAGRRLQFTKCYWSEKALLWLTFELRLKGGHGAMQVSGEEHYRPRKLQM